MLKRTNPLSADQQPWCWIISTILLVAILFSYQFIYTGLPYFAKKIANSLPVSLYKALDRQTLSALDAGRFKATQLSVAEQVRLTSLFQSLIPPIKTTQASPNRHKKYQLIFRQWPNNPNAMALANGSIIMTDEILKLIIRDDEISAILLHEIGHIEHNHVMTHLIQSSIITLTLSVLFGDVTAMTDILMDSATFGLGLQYSREAEAAADHYSAERLHAIYGNSSALANALTKLEIKKNDDTFSWLSSHPNLTQRIEDIKKQSEREK